MKLGDMPAFATTTDVYETIDFAGLQAKGNTPYGMQYGPAPMKKVINTTGGMTLRQYYAGLAMQGYLNSIAFYSEQNPNVSDAVIAEWAVGTADALLAALEK